MRPSLLSLLYCFLLLSLAHSLPEPRQSKQPQRKTSLLIDPDAQPSLPSAKQVASNASSLPVDNIQGDILVGMKKKRELFFFFAIDDPAHFKDVLKNYLLPLITTVDQLLSVSTQPITAINIAFSKIGLDTLGITDNLNDQDFNDGQFLNAQADFYDRPSSWVDEFKKGYIHGVLLLASDTQANIDSQLNDILSNMGGAMHEVYRLQGAARPGSEEGHEHFGFMDGISQPHVDGFGASLPGQKTIPPGEILLGETGDHVGRPYWATDGSFLAFRQLQQFVPEFNKFLLDNPIIMPGMTPQQGAEFMGARMVGRWKSGAPIELAPLADDPIMAADPNQNNDFDYSVQNNCPFSAHIRKTNPRADLGNTDSFHIMRAGIPYGPEVTDKENITNTSIPDTKFERGLAFVSYQSVIGEGFKFIQQTWANSPSFAHGTGMDPIIGTNGGSPFTVTGLDPANSAAPTTILSDFVLSRGGEYFFSPSIQAIDTVLTV